MEGLSSFIEIDNHSAVDVGHLRNGIRSFHVQEARFCEEYPEAANREGGDELTSRADDVKTLKTCIIIYHFEENRW